MPFRTDQGGIGNNPIHGFRHGVKDIGGKDRTYMGEFTDKLGSANIPCFGSTNTQLSTSSRNARSDEVAYDNLSIRYDSSL